MAFESQKENEKSKTRQLEHVYWPGDHLTMLMGMFFTTLSLVTLTLASAGILTSL